MTVTVNILWALGLEKSQSCVPKWWTLARETAGAVYNTSSVNETLHFRLQSRISARYTWNSQLAEFRQCINLGCPYQSIHRDNYHRRGYCMRHLAGCPGGIREWCRSSSATHLTILMPDCILMQVECSFEIVLVNILIARFNWMCLSYSYTMIFPTLKEGIPYERCVNICCRITACIEELRQGVKHPQNTSVLINMADRTTFKRQGTPLACNFTMRVAGVKDMIICVHIAWPVS